MKKSKINNKKLLAFIAILLVAILPLIFNFKRGTMTMLNTVIIYAIIAIGFNILLGYAGQISLGHAAFMGIGAYVSAFVSNHLTLPLGLHFIVAILLSGLVPLVVGLLLGLVALRLEGHYLAIATLGFGVAIQQVFKEWIGFTNGYSGMRADPIEIFNISFRSREMYFVLSVLVLVLLSIFAYNLLRSKTGRALVAMRDSEHAAQAMGISLFKYKLVAFAVSAFYAGVAGSLYMHLIRFTMPDQWGVMLSLNLLAMVVIGGLASIEGGIVGAAFIIIIPEIIKGIPVIGEIRSLPYIFTGVSMILVIMFFPYGLAKIGAQIKQLIRNKNRAPKNNEV
ncbi:branched-chain amino acid ABC transporter permease [Sporosalibacterium faouarense]|uniref:branched-chain amino acid ABC transporter permease n=1 Tax=Sporosalibacterium faouarense TaxID=516123 RepID=UPI00141D35E9|nr:branched-chain amino acid ABC transporter permease [Sporosalibacterium faouarense]MTI46467.1 branched-chain amino acid ABC transporter permease [Bacillota bacterium]